MKKILIFIITLIFSNAQIKAQGSADQYKYSPSNPLGLRDWSDHTPKNYAPATPSNNSKPNKSPSYHNESSDRTYKFTRVKVNDKYGYNDESGNPALPAIYDDAAV